MANYYHTFKYVALTLLTTNGGILGGRDSSVGKLSASHAGDLSSNPGGGLTGVTQCMYERGRDYQL